MSRRCWFRLGTAGVLAAVSLFAQDAREIVRKSVELDQANWLRMKDYTWTAREVERHYDSDGKLKSQESKAWETMILYGEPHRRMIERDGKPLPPDEQRKEQAKLDKAIAKLERESPEDRQSRMAEYDQERRKQRDFLREIPDMFDLRIVGEEKVDGHDAWVIAATPKPGYEPKHSDAKPLLKIRGKLWIDKVEYQWVRLEAETTDTISFGLFLVRLYAGAKLIFEQTRLNNEIWLPRRQFVKGAGRIGLIKKVSIDDDLTWNNYHKFQVDSKILPPDSRP